MKDQKGREEGKEKHGDEARQRLDDFDVGKKGSETTGRCQHVLPVERKLDPHESLFLAAAFRF